MAMPGHATVGQDGWLGLWNARDLGGTPARDGRAVREGALVRSEAPVRTFVADAQQLYRRLTMLVRDGVVEHVFYPVFPPDQHAQQVLHHLRRHGGADATAGPAVTRPS
ncbi:tyrosine-protein phosphatase [Pseudokineococcus basanitobsidens]|uniref:Tyrosine-protein phosphatase n=1 Tax=Pseudokineococcus basanitobsidens TaxID=1926649 RepID=A0ABU8RN76_9ACTN